MCFCSFLKVQFEREVDSWVSVPTGMVGQDGLQPKASGFVGNETQKSTFLSNTSFNISKYLKPSFTWMSLFGKITSEPTRRPTLLDSQHHTHWFCGYKQCYFVPVACRHVPLITVIMSFLGSEMRWRLQGGHGSWWVLHKIDVIYYLRVAPVVLMRACLAADSLVLLDLLYFSDTAARCHCEDCGSLCLQDDDRRLSEFQHVVWWHFSSITETERDSDFWSSPSRVTGGVTLQRMTDLSVRVAGAFRFWTCEVWSQFTQQWVPQEWFGPHRRDSEGVLALQKQQKIKQQSKKLQLFAVSIDGDWHDYWIKLKAFRFLTLWGRLTRRRVQITWPI